MKFVYIFIIIALLPICNYAQGISHSNDLQIVLNKKTLDDPNLQYGIEPFYNNNRLEFFPTKNSGTFIGFYLVVLKDDYIKKLKFNKRNEVVKNGKDNAVINIGFYGIYPNSNKFSPNIPILIKETNNTDAIAVSQLISDIVISGKLIKNINTNDLYLICFDVNDKNNVSAKSFLKEKFKLTLHSKFVYILWDKNRCSKEPDFLDNATYSLSLVSELCINSNKNTSPTIDHNRVQNDSIISNNDLIIRNNIEKYLESKNIILIDKNYEIEFPKTGDVILLRNLKSKPKQEDPYKIILKYRNIDIKFTQS